MMEEYSTIKSAQENSYEQYREDNQVPENTQNDLKTPSDLADRYEFVRKLGAGAQAKVFEAIRKKDGEHVAIKILDIDSVQNWKSYDLFWREVNTLKQLDESGVAKFYEAIENIDCQAPHAYLIQQCIQGKTLKDMIDSGYRFHYQKVFQIAVQLIDLLEKLHTHEPCIIHRDLKPSNIMLEPKGSNFKAYLIDFGAVSNPLLQKGGSTVAGTYGYMPPEQLMGQPTPASDIYALGATIAGLLSGIEPADMEVADYRLLIEKPLEYLPHAIVACLRQMTMPNQDERLCDYAELRKMFSDFSVGKFEVENQTAHKDISSDKKYNEALKAVTAYGQWGNFDLWLHLPESVPRKVPKCYRNRRPTRRCGLILDPTFSIFNPAYFFKRPGLYILNVLFAILMIAISPLILAYFIITSWYAFLGLVLGAILLVPFLCLIILFFPIRNLCRLMDGDSIIPFYYVFDFMNDEDGVFDDVDIILKQGRKAIATVVDIKYLGVEPKDKGIYPIADVWSVPATIDKRCNAVLTSSLPKFELTYAFNPPDDASENDLKHHVTLSFDPSPKVKIGDMLPILYYISPKDNSDVMSMPFPIPLNQVHTYKDMYYRKPKETDKPAEEQKNKESKD